MSESTPYKSCHATDNVEPCMSLERERVHLIRAVMLQIMLNPVCHLRESAPYKSCHSTDNVELCLSLGVLVIAGEKREECRHAFGQV